MQEFILNHRYQFIGGSAALILFIIGIFVLNQENTTLIDEELSWTETSFSANETISSELPVTSHEFFVDVKGAVAKPGIYEVEEGMRVWDVLQMAGGLKEEADENQINLSQRVSDQMVIYVPKMGEISDSPAFFEQAGEEAAEGKVNLNTASEQELMTLSGIGQKKAQEIINYREAHGKFKSINELTNITGIGEKTIEKLKDDIFVS
ncbi:helix-hairpin-helix domain-containing protein [Enterococcus sp. LJL51]|uniref:helix-hairpin-helix domain-containing protein n=1 Tax=Enterococcus sp. LJL51 TaxID=3416656 RepID=UPI003CF5E1F6